MRTKLLSTLLLFLTVLCSAQSVGDFFSDTNDISYRIASLNPNEVHTNDYLGTNTVVNIPSTVTHNGVSFSVTQIGASSFESNSLTSVTLPNTLKILHSAAFFNNNINSITLPTSLISIGTNALRSNNLSSITIPSSVTTIGKQALQDNNFTSITLPSSVASIGQWAFIDNPITSVTYERTSPGSNYNAFFSNLSSIDLFIPDGVCAYKSSGWSIFKSITETPVTGNVTYYYLGLTNTNGIISSNVSSACMNNNYFPSGTVVELTATPDSGYLFTNWSGDASGTTNISSITMDSNKSITATFTSAASPGLTKYYVDANVSAGNGSGDSWVNAIENLEDALTASSNNTKEIWIAAGKYSPGSSSTDTFEIDSDGLSIYGGFDGTETLLSERDIIANPTILSGDIVGDDAVLSTNHNSNTTRHGNSRKVVTVNANNIVIDGVSIQDGYANQITGVNGYGASIDVGATSEDLVIRNCEIKDNFSLNGGLVTNFDVSTTMTIENCKFSNNYARLGSGLYFNVSSGTVTLNLINTLFINNSSVDIYASLTAFTGSSAWIRSSGSGANLTTNIVNCTFANNSDLGSRTNVTEKGTLALSRRTDGMSTHNATVSNCIFYGNTDSNGTATLAIGKGHVNSPNQTDVYNSIDEDGFSNITSTTNTSNSDPLFTNASNDDFTLQSTSPAIDAGNNTYNTTTYALAGNDRIFNTTIDMGAFEYDGATASSDDFILTGFTTYPNPVENTLTIDLQDELKQVEVFSLSGKKIITSTATEIDMSSLSEGIRKRIYTRVTPKT